MYTIHNSIGTECPHNERIVGDSYPDHPKAGKDSDFVYAYHKTEDKSAWIFDGWADIDDLQATMDADADALKHYKYGKVVSIQAEIRPTTSGTSETALKKALGSAVMELFTLRETESITQEEFAERFAALQEAYTPEIEWIQRILDTS